MGFSRTQDQAIPQRPVSICGIGAVSGYGWGEKLLREGLYTSESSVLYRSGFSPAFEDDWGWASLVDDAGNPDDGPSRMMRAVRHAGREAVHNAFDRGWRPEGTVGLVHGIVLGDVGHWRDYHHRRGEGTTRRNWLELMPSTMLMEFMKEFNFHGPTMAVTAMCASGVAGLLTARMWINAGIATDVVVIVSDLSFTPENARSFSNLGVLHVDAPSWDVCRPFQEGSRGFSAGEASVAMVVSARPRASYGTVLGGAMTSDAYHPVSIAPDYAQVRRAFTGALQDAGVFGSDVAYLNAHGTGTAQCDGVEAALFDELLPAAEGIFSLKPLVGHTQGASAAIEIMSTLYGFQTGVIPAPRRISKGHSKLLDGLTACAEGPVMKSSLGMGGHNAVLLLEAPAP
jgi:3-oxoacyl-[acyl-carrier-protein] synthase II